MAAPRNLGFTPSQRGPALGDERPASGRQRDPVLSTKGWKTSDIRLTAGGTDMSAGNAHVYNFGLVSQDSVGRYMLTAQSAASATADPLGAVEWIELEIREESAGVFKVDPVTDLSSLTADGDELASDHRTNIAKAAFNTDADTPVFTTTDGDGDVGFTVTTATTAGTLNGISGITIDGGAPDANHFCIVECRSTTTEVWSIERTG
jgi:hypothetical protein